MDMDIDIIIDIDMHIYIYIYDCASGCYSCLTWGCAQRGCASLCLSIYRYMYIYKIDR